MNDFEELDKENIIQYMKTIVNSKIGIKLVKNSLGLFHMYKKEIADEQYLNPESWITILT